MNLSNIAKKMILVIGISALVISIIGVVVCMYRSIPAYPFVLGTILGSAFTAAKVVMLERAIYHALDMEDGRASGNYVRIQYLIRFLLTGAVLLVGALPAIPFISLWGVVAGIFTMQIAALCNKFFIEDSEKQDDKTS